MPRCCNYCARYEKIAKQLWGSEREDYVFLMMGGFHAEFMMMSAAYKYAKENGRDEHLLGAEVFAGANSCAKALEGKHFKRGCRVIRLEFERCLVRLIEVYCEHGPETETEKFLAVREKIAGANGNGETLRKVLATVEWKECCDAGRRWAKRKGESEGMVQYELNQIEVYETLVGWYIAGRGMRTTGVVGMLAMLRKMESLAVWANRTSYKKFVQTTIAMLESAPEMYPFLAKGIESGDLLAVNTVGSDVFSALWPDEFLEKGTNKKGKEIVVKIPARTNAMLATLTAMSTIGDWFSAARPLLGHDLSKRRQKKKDVEGLPKRPAQDKKDLEKMTEVHATLKYAQIYDTVHTKEQVWNKISGLLATVEAAKSLLGFPGNTMAVIAEIDALLDPATTSSIWDSFQHGYKFDHFVERSIFT